MGSTPDPSGDYGYDMAHEDLEGARQQTPASSEQQHVPPPPSGAQDPAGDYGYDEAHGF